MSTEVIFILFTFVVITQGRFIEIPDPLNFAWEANVVISQEVPLFRWNPPDCEHQIRNQGYPAEVHKVHTEDGFILTVFRIPHGKNQTGRVNKKKPPVIVQHGYLCTSDCWTIPDSSVGIVYRLADRNFDVWIPNSRGTTYSMKHQVYTPKDAEFWDYSVHELGYYDLPAVIDYITNYTSFSKVSYVGHSQGTTQLFIMGSERPEYMEKLAVGVCMGPVGYLNNTEGLVHVFSHFSRMAIMTLKAFNIHHLLEHYAVLNIFNPVICGEYSPFHVLCKEVIFAITGFDSPQFNTTIGSMALDYCPSGTSTKQLDHFGQLANNGGSFTKYDYGKKINWKKYHSISPPSYNLSKVTAPIACYYAPNDFIAIPANAKRLCNDLGNLKKLYKVPDDKFNHLDFMWAIDINKLLNDDVIRTIEKLQDRPKYA